MMCNHGPEMQAQHFENAKIHCTSNQHSKSAMHIVNLFDLEHVPIVPHREQDVYLHGRIFFIAFHRCAKRGCERLYFTYMIQADKY